jgi:predicted secreted acid phosphatase
MSAKFPNQICVADFVRGRVAAAVAVVALGWLIAAPSANAQPVLTWAGSQPANVGDLEMQTLAYQISGNYERKSYNLVDLKREALHYHQSGGYARDLQLIGAEAGAFVQRRAGEVRRPALVLDIDETSLSNWPELRANNFDYVASGPCHLPKGPCGAHAWEMSARAAAIAPTLGIYKAARRHGVSVFFITGRDEGERVATERNLRRAGYRGWAGVIMRPAGSRTASAADYKAPARARIEAMGFTIIANVGDQPSDLSGGHAEAAFLLPNPFYRIP